MGLPESERAGRLKILARLIMDAAGIEKYTLETEKSEVYGETLDVVAEDLELGSGAMGPHPLDRQWDITVPWVGIGFGLERLVMIRKGIRNVQKVGRSLAYLNGIRLNI
jgi:aspartyl-tRNA synthetase